MSADHGQRMVRALLADGSMQLVTVGRAIALVKEGQAEPLGWSADDGRAVLAELERRENALRRQLANDGLLMDAVNTPRRVERWR